MSQHVVREETASGVRDRPEQRGGEAAIIRQNSLVFVDTPEHLSQCLVLGLQGHRHPCAHQVQRISHSLRGDARESTGQKTRPRVFSAKSYIYFYDYYFPDCTCFYLNRALSVCLPIALFFAALPFRAVHVQDSLPLFVSSKLHRRVRDNPDHGRAISTPQTEKTLGAQRSSQEFYRRPGRVRLLRNLEVDLCAVQRRYCGFRQRARYRAGYQARPYSLSI